MAVINLKPAIPGAKVPYFDGYIYEKQESGIWKNTGEQYRNSTPLMDTINKGKWNLKVYSKVNGKYRIYIDKKEIFIDPEQLDYVRGLIEIWYQAAKIREIERKKYQQINTFVETIFNEIEYDLDWENMALPNDAELYQLAIKVRNQTLLTEEQSVFDRLSKSQDFLDAFRAFFEKRLAYEAKIQSRIYLSVPYDEKDEAKAFGAEWDGNRKKWYTYRDNPQLTQLAKWKSSNSKPEDWLVV